MKKLILALCMPAIVFANDIDYEAKYNQTLSDISKVEQKVINTQNSNRWLEFYNTELVPLQNLVNAYITLKNHDFINDTNPNWIFKDYNDLLRNTSFLYGMSNAQVKIRDHNSYNYRALIDYTNEHVDDEVTRDFNQFVRVNGERLINK